MTSYHLGCQYSPHPINLCQIVYIIFHVLTAFRPNLKLNNPITRLLYGENFETNINIRETKKKQEIQKSKFFFLVNATARPNL